MKKIFIPLLFAPAFSFAGDVNIEISWQGLETSFTYIQATEIFRNEGETSTAFQFDKKIDGLYIQESSFLGMFTSNETIEGKYRYILTVEKKEGGDFYLEGETILISKVDKEVKNFNHADVNKTFPINFSEKCLEKDEKYPTLEICISKID